MVDGRDTVGMAAGGESGRTHRTVERWSARDPGGRQAAPQGC